MDPARSMEEVKNNINSVTKMVSGTLVIGSTQCYDMWSYSGSCDGQADQMHGSMCRVIRGQWQRNHDDYAECCTDVLVDVEHFLSAAAQGDSADKEIQHVFNVLRQLGCSSHSTRSNYSDVVTILSKNLSLTVKSKTFNELLMADYYEHINQCMLFICKGEFAGTAFDNILLYSNVFLRFSEYDTRKEVMNEFYQKLKEVMVVLLENYVGSLLCLCKMLKLAGKAFEEVDSTYEGDKGITLTTIFDKIKRLISKRESIDRRTLRMLVGLVELRSANWDEKFDNYSVEDADLTGVCLDPLYLEMGVVNSQAPSDESGLPLPACLTDTNFWNDPECSSPACEEKVSAADLQFLVDNEYTDHRFDEQMTEAFEKFSINSEQ